MDIVPGQRFASATEPDLGLGMVIDVEGRRMTVLFPAAGERRVYAMDNAPLHRVQYSRGDRVEDDTRRALRILSAEEHDGRLHYVCEDNDGRKVDLDEANLSPFAQFTTPAQRLANGQVDNLRAYRLRIEALNLSDRLARSEVRGLRGPRVALLPHQLYIADTVAQRHAPRVLLADEVGLGKTIEAGLIAHHQIETGRARRVLILVPDSLVHQWLVEMRRRFNLDFAVFDSKRIDALREEGYDQPFDAEQQILCPMSLLIDDESVGRDVLAASWDLTIVDEAHHLVWDPDAEFESEVFADSVSDSGSDHARSDHESDFDLELNAEFDAESDLESDLESALDDDPDAELDAGLEAQIRLKLQAKLEEKLGSSIATDRDSDPLAHLLSDLLSDTGPGAEPDTQPDSASEPEPGAEASPESAHGTYATGSNSHNAGVKAYRLVEQLAASSAGLLLLTATPEQLGADSHFARLRLLDPARFSDLDAFRDEQAGYHSVNQHLEPLLDSTATLSDAQRTALASYIDTPVPAELDDDQREALLAELLDRHGTGRVLFRNTRRTVPDFPGRVVHPVVLDDVTAMPADSDPTLTDIQTALYGDDVDEPDWRSDSRVAWLVEFLKADRTRKVLVICHRMQHARTLDEYLTLREGLRSTSFYEGLSLLERDRAAAYFAQGADDGGGAQVLVCSEIGSEGRNFQFAQHLVLFDLPAHADLLEQRIGRLDRIGQQATIHIHVPMCESTPTHALFRWYHEGLGAFEKSVPGAAQIQTEFEQDLSDALLSSGDGLDALVNATRERTASVIESLALGRDRLVELNSSNPKRAAALVEQLKAEDEDRQLATFLTAAFDQFGIEQEEDSRRTIILRPTERVTAHLPGLDEDGLTATYDREHALAREDLQFMSPEHPIAREALAQVINGDVGNAALCTMSLKGLPAGTMLLEAWFSALVIAPPGLGIDRFLGASPTRFLIAANGSNVATTLPSDRLDGLCRDVDGKTARKVLREVRPSLDAMVGHAKRHAEQTLPTVIDAARTRLVSHLTGERDRLRALAQRNRNVRADEIEFLEMTLEQSESLLDQAQARLDALRLVVNT